MLYEVITSDLKISSWPWKTEKKSCHVALKLELPMKDLKVIVFDCDGVLFDTEAANRAYYNHILKHFGKPVMTANQFAYAHQHTLNDRITSYNVCYTKLLRDKLVRGHRRFAKMI